MCNNDWSEYNSAKSFYKSCGHDVKPIYNINIFKKKMKNIENILFKNNIYVIYVGWSGVGTE